MGAFVAGSLALLPAAVWPYVTVVSRPLHIRGHPLVFPKATTVPAIVTPDAASRRGDLPILAIAIAIFTSYMTIGLALPVIPLYVHQTLGFGNVLVGVSIGIQFIATVMTRSYAGRVADAKGGGRSMRSGLVFCALSGLAYVIAARAPVPPLGSYILLLAARLVLGFGESQLIVGGLAWGIGLAGHQRAGKVLTWTGMAIFGSLAVGAPVGLWLNHMAGFAAVGAVNVVLPLIGLAIVARVPGVTPVGGARQPLSSIIRLIWRAGLGLALQGVGFAVIGAFVSLDFVAHGWSGTGFTLSLFGVAFVVVRIFAGRLPDRIGGAKVAIASLAVEAIGQVVLWQAPTAGMALLGAAITGAGCSMVYPAFGVEVVKRVPPQSRGTALGGFAAFQDIAYATTGPLAGVLASAFGYPAVFALGAVSAVLGLGMALLMLREDRGPRPQGGATR